MQRNRKCRKWLGSMLAAGLLLGGITAAEAAVVTGSFDSRVYENRLDKFSTMRVYNVEGEQDVPYVSVQEYLTALYYGDVAFQVNAAGSGLTAVRNSFCYGSHLAEDALFVNACHFVGFVVYTEDQRPAFTVGKCYNRLHVFAAVFRALNLEFYVLRFAIQQFFFSHPGYLFRFVYGDILICISLVYISLVYHNFRSIMSFVK